MHSQKVRDHVPPAFDGRPVLRMFVDPGHMDFCAQVAFPDFGGSMQCLYPWLLRNRETHLGPFRWLPPHFLVSGGPEIHLEGSHVKVRSAQLSGLTTVPLSLAHTYHYSLTWQVVDDFDRCGTLIQATSIPDYATKLELGSDARGRPFIPFACAGSSRVPCRPSL